VDSAGSGWDPVVVSCELCYVLSVIYKGGELLDQLRDNQFLEKGSVSDIPLLEVTVF
jgi:hypothetical protein